MTLESIKTLSSLIPLFPLLGFLILGLMRGKLSKSMSSLIGCSTIAISFVLTLITFSYLQNHESIKNELFPFLFFGDSYLPFGFFIDHLTAIYLMVITGVGFLIHIYSTSYMHHESSRDYARYFSYLNLFVFSMLILVMGSNYVITFIGWEGVGLCSYLLIGFWYQNIPYTKAAQKAFVMNRIGDLGFLAGMYMIYSHVGSLDFETVNQYLSSNSDHSWYNFAAFCLFMGATGKSAQIPLFTWLPDAMAGPTPVSALIHAATMVTAGIYLIARSSLLFNDAPEIMNIIAWIGLATALMAATIATQQNDIKKVLAYSTVSQLGFMFIALGMGAYTAALFHVITHAFFKALLFLGSGSVIHAMGGEQNMKYMGGLMKKMKVTGTTFWIGTLAIAGIPGFSGFFSKDEILMDTYMHNKIIWILAIITALLTAYYMFRIMFLTFYGKFRGTDEQDSHVHESPKAMTIPLVILAVLSLFGGLINFPEIFGGNHWLENYISTSVHEISESHLSHNTEWILMGIATLGAVVGFFWARSTYSKETFQHKTGILGFFQDKWKVDEFYQTIITEPLLKVSRFLKNEVEPNGIDAIVNGIGAVVPKLADRFRLLQNGKVGFYMFALVIGMIAILCITFFIEFYNK